MTYRNALSSLLWIAIVAARPSVAVEDATLAVSGLRCEYLENPLGIDVAKPRLSWRLHSPARNRAQTAYQVLVASDRSRLAEGNGDLWDSGRVESCRTVHVEYEGKRLGNLRRAHWKVRVWDRDGSMTESDAACWETGLDQDAWTGRWITSPKDGSASHPLFRKAFHIEKPMDRARAVVACLGYFELHVNGRLVGDHVLDPVQSDYAKRLYYVTHDVTEYLHDGVNVVGLALGNGWYKSGVHGVTLSEPPVLVEIHITFRDGTTERIVTGADWKTARGWITAFGDFPHGEIHDARNRPDGWNDNGFDDAAWTNAAEADVPPLRISAQMIPPNRVVETLGPVSVRPLEDGAVLFDFGRNLTGRFRLRVREPKDAEFHLSYFASHFAQGDDLRENMNQHDRYVCRGDALDVFESRFNYRAFRYVKVLGLSKAPAAADASATLISTDTPRTSRFECSDPVLNRLYETVVHTHRCLTLGGIQVDCPHRERLGYGAEGQATLGEGLYNFDTGAFYAKWTRDFHDGQDADSGSIPYTAPFRIASGGGPAWPAAIITFPHEVHRFYGDRRVLEEHYEAMKRWTAFLETKTENGIFRRFQLREGPETPWEFLGDWAAPGKSGELWPGYWPTLRENRLFNACNYVQNLSALSRIARVLGKDADARAFENRSADIRADLQREFYDATTHRYSDGPKQQTALAYPLLVEAVPEVDRVAVMGNLLTDITQIQNGHLDTGVLGSRVLLDLLMQEDRSDLIHDMVAKRTFPGWGHMMENGASTLWEHWFPAYSHLCSSIHNSYLSIGDWFFRGLGGIRPDWSRPGFAHTIIRPAFECDLEYVHAEYDSVRGPIRSSWKKSERGIELTVAIPANTSAEVHVPASDPATVDISGNGPGRPADVRFRRTERGRAVFETGSGETTFRVSREEAGRDFQP